MKAIDIIKGFCTNWNDCENCDWVKVPEYESEEEYREWAMGYYGFIPKTLKPGVTYLVVWEGDRFITGRAYEEPDAYYMDEDHEVKFYEIEQ